ncbi:UDP-N-acetylglucosamine transporter TMEM241 homolog [Argopecten irradians]|uniref:UDP-N-acetylglucosamine transporter TMEM241 homolog n=1 Tax=Argopecten irradians TaxID=31199 RepID=UPI003713981F
MDFLKNTPTRCFIFCFLFLVTNFVNKYVLSVLEFKYPTIFQGWQTFVGFLVIRMGVVTRHLPSMLTEKESIRHRAVMWIPGMILFVSVIYSGSKALANLTLPVFLSLQNLVTVINCTTQMAISRKLMSLFSYLMLMLVITSSIGIVNSDPQFSAEGYFWMCIHIVCTGVFQIYTKLTKSRLKISSHEKLYCNYIYSMILLAPCSYLIGDALAAIKFPYLYFSKFYIGCIFSGVFGVLLNLYTIRLQEAYLESIEFVRIQGFAKMVCSMFSLQFFDMTVTAPHAVWISANQLAGFVCEDPMLPSTTSTVIGSESSTNQNYDTEATSSNRQTSYSREDTSSSGMASYTMEYNSPANHQSSKNTQYSSSTNHMPSNKTEFSSLSNHMSSNKRDYPLPTNHMSPHREEFSSPANSMASSFHEQYYQPRTTPGLGTKHNVLYDDFLKDDQQ